LVFDVKRQGGRTKVVKAKKPIAPKKEPVAVVA